MKLIHEGLHPSFLARQDCPGAVLRSDSALFKAGLLALGSIYSPYLPIFSVHPDMANCLDIFFALITLSSEYKLLKFPKFITPPCAEVLSRENL
jgi:hypothetical protein